MKKQNITVSVYGAEQVCVSCVGAPGSIETYEWLQAAIGRKYIDESIKYEYININENQDIEKHQKFAERIFKEDLFYPVVLINDKIIAEGIPRLKPIYRALDEHGALLQT